MEICLDSAVSMGGGISYNDDIMDSFQKFIVVTFCSHPPPQKQAYANWLWEPCSGQLNETQCNVHLSPIYELLHSQMILSCPRLVELLGQLEV